MTDDHLARIDEVLHDFTVSDDAMRCRPAPVDASTSSEPVMASGGMIWVSTADAEDDDGWQRLDGLASIEFGEESVTVEVTPDLERFTASLRTVQEAMAATMAVAEQALRWFAEALQQDGEWVDTNGDPVQPPARPRPPLPRRDRPAWQSPHGPAHKRRR